MVKPTATQKSNTFHKHNFDRTQLALRKALNFCSLCHATGISNLHVVTPF